MSKSISRKLYRLVLLLYPEPFRREFGDEMDGMFEECGAAQGSWNVLADVVFSAAKQQIQYLSTPAPKSAPLYSEITWSPNLARILAVAVIGVALIASVLTGGKAEPSEAWTRPCGRSAIAGDRIIGRATHFSSGEGTRHE